MDDSFMKWFSLKWVRRLLRNSSYDKQQEQSGRVTHSQHNIVHVLLLLVLSFSHYSRIVSLQTLIQGIGMSLSTISSCSFMSLVAFLFILLTCCSVEVLTNDKLILCVPRGIDPVRMKKYCQMLEKSEGNTLMVRCILAQDRLECARLILEGRADFARLNPSDLLSLNQNGYGDTIVAGELRYTLDDPYQYSVMLIARREMVVDNTINLNGKHLCLPGYQVRPIEDWTPFHARFLEIREIPQECNPNVSWVENRARSSSSFLSAACIPGPWSIHNDFHLKSKFSNLCSLCTHPGQCSEHDEFWGPAGSLICLTDGPGDFAWARMNNIFRHFKTKTKEEMKQYVIICPNGKWQRFDNYIGCEWINHPWPVILSHKSKADRTSQFMAALIGTENEKQAAALEIKISEAQKETLPHLMSLYGKKFEPTDPMPTKSFLRKANGFLSAFYSLKNFHCASPVNFCVETQIELKKCRWMSAAASIWTTYPLIKCVTPPINETCLSYVGSRQADVVVINPEKVHQAIKQHQLMILLHEWLPKMTAGLPDVPSLGFLVPRSSKFMELHDLRGHRLCIPKKFGLAWSTIEMIFHEENLLPLDCPWDDDSLSNYFREVHITHTDQDSLDCLTSELAEAAVVNLMNVTEKLNVNFRTICIYEHGNQIKIYNQTFCSYSWISPGQVMIHKDQDPWRRDEISDLLQEMSIIFSGDPSKTAVEAFRIFGPFDNVKNVIFHDSTFRLIRYDSQILENAIKTSYFWNTPSYDSIKKIPNRMLCQMDNSASVLSRTSLWGLFFIICVIFTSRFL